MLMGHPPQIITRGRENVLQGCFEGLTPVQVPMVVQELVPSDSKMQEVLADTLEAVQEIAQAGPNPVHGMTVNTRALLAYAYAGQAPEVKQQRLILDSRVVIDQAWCNRLFLQAFRGDHAR
jgi:hypothetical protein